MNEYTNDRDRKQNAASSKAHFFGGLSPHFFWFIGLLCMVTFMFPGSMLANFLFFCFIITISIDCVLTFYVKRPLSVFLKTMFKALTGTDRVTVKH